jgi:hypothetical protein
MLFMKRCIVAVIIVLFVGGCAKRELIPLEDVEKSNDVELVLKSGQKVAGTVIKDEPHQLVLYRDGRMSVPIPKSDIQTIKRKPPVYDDFGKPISEPEIEKEMTHRNALIYGCGGGLLTIGGSFFIGSLLANESEGNADAILGATVGLGGGAGTVLFTRAGMAKDRRDAIERVKRNRQLSVEIKQDAKPAGEQKSLQDQIIEEKQRQEDLRKERERLLRELEEKNQTNP